MPPSGLSNDFWPISVQKRRSAWRAPSRPPRISPEAMITALTAPADAPLTALGKLSLSCSNRSSTPQVKAP